MHPPCTNFGLYIILTGLRAARGYVGLAEPVPMLFLSSHWRSLRSRIARPAARRQVGSNTCPR